MKKRELDVGSFLKQISQFGAIKKLVTVMMLFSSFTCAKAANYYFSSSAGDDSRMPMQAQHPATPWKTIKKLNSYFHDLKPGDSIFFRRGDVFIGQLTINKSGVSGAPIVISTYGAGKVPVFQYDIRGNIDTPVFKRAIVYAPAGICYITVEGIKLTDTTMSASTIHAATTANVAYGVDFNGNSTTGCNNIVLKNLDISLVGNAIELHGNNNTVTNCTIYDLGGIRNNYNDEKNFGGNGITFGGSNNTITHNIFKNLWRTDNTFKYDGGAFEIFGAVAGKCSNNVVMYNTVINCQGVMEMGSNNKNDIASNNVFAYNLFINNAGRLFAVHNGEDAFSLQVNHLKFFNNNIIETYYADGNAPNMLWASSSGTTAFVVIKNNIFWLETNVNVAKKGCFKGARLIHSNNVYHLNGGSLNFTLAPTELILSNNTPVFSNTISNDPFQWDYKPIKGAPTINFGINVGLTRDFKGSLINTNQPTAGMLQ